MSSIIRRRMVWWIVGGITVGCMPFVLFGFLIFLVIVAALMVIGGLGFFQTQSPPPLPVNSPVYSAQWLALIHRQGTPLPSPVIVAAIAATSKGLPLAKTSAGGYGLLTLPHAADEGNPSLALKQWSQVIRQDWVPNALLDTLTRAGHAVRPPQAGLAGTIRQTLNILEQGPALVAWPESFDWGRPKLVTIAGIRIPNLLSGIQWIYPQHQRIDVVAVAAAPLGARYTIPWTPPQTQCTPHHGKISCRVITDNLTGRDLVYPTSMTLTTSTGHIVPMEPTTSLNNSVAFPGAVLYQTVRPVLINRTHPAQITAQWHIGRFYGIASVTLPSRGVAYTSTTVSTTYRFVSNAAAVRHWWPDILAASRATGVPADLIGAIMIHESGGNPAAYNPYGPAFGLMQILPSTAAGLPSYAPGWETNPALNLLLGAELLREDYQETGGVSWHAAIAAYYGGLGRMEQDGFVPGMPWSEAAPLLNVVPAAWAGNTETMTAYADAMIAAMAVIAQEAPKS